MYVWTSLKTYKCSLNIDFKSFFILIVFLANAIIITRLTNVHFYISFIPFCEIFTTLQCNVFHTCWALVIVSIKKVFLRQSFIKMQYVALHHATEQRNILHQCHTFRCLIKFKNCFKALGREAEHVWCCLCDRDPKSHTADSALHYWQSYIALRHSDHCD